MAKSIATSDANKLAAKDREQISGDQRFTLVSDMFNKDFLQQCHYLHTGCIESILQRS